SDEKVLSQQRAVTLAQVFPTPTADATATMLKTGKVTRRRPTPVGATRREALIFVIIFFYRDW
ncbi:hypothetical protein RG836_23510, partial [Pseudomonas sp. SZMC_28357]|uniref:hypothetical protein n=1 Tax=Pseudomonas sp. SZMC_28357 TaxID=3074380 RepID=UPI0028719092